MGSSGFFREGSNVVGALAHTRGREEALALFEGAGKLDPKGLFDSPGGVITNEEAFGEQSRAAGKESRAAADKFIRLRPDLRGFFPDSAPPESRSAQAVDVGRRAEGRSAPKESVSQIQASPRGGQGSSVTVLGQSSFKKTLLGD